jgi:hypothetical protein
MMGEIAIAQQREPLTSDARAHLDPHRRIARWRLRLMLA